MMKKMRLCIAVLLVAFMLGVPERVEAATASQVKSCTKEILEMLYTADLSRHDISRYRLTKNEFLDVLEEVRYGEGAEIEGAYFPSMSINYTTSGNYVKSVWLLDVNGDAVERYNQMQPVIQSILAGVEADMTDLDKLIYLHDEVVDWVTYQQTTEAMYTASGAFIDKKAVCAGYAKALNILLHRVGIDATYVKGTSLNHGWSYVELDGQWYHVDPTWDDTRSSAKGQISRKDLLRNDVEFSKDHGVWTVKRIDEASGSTLYSDWFVHDIVGEMSFEDGLWYYLDTKNKLVMAADVNEGTKEAVFNYSSLGTVALVDAVDDGLVLRVNGRQTCQTVEQWKVTTEGKQEESSSGGAVITYALDFSDISLWRTGHYNPNTGTYAANPKRICLNEVIANTESQYRIKISDETYAIIVRELNEKHKLINSVELRNGDLYVPGEGTEYLAISLYNCVKVNEYAVYYSEYEALFAEGFELRFLKENEKPSEEPKDEVAGDVMEELPKEDVTEELPKEDATEELPNEDATEELPNEDATEEDTENIARDENAFDVDMCDLSNWRSGHYNPNTGTYAANPKRICLNEVIANTESQYRIKISDETYAIVVRELNEKHRLINSVELRNGDLYIPGEGTKYLAISLYNCVKANEYAVYYSEYEALFAEEFELGFFKENEKPSEEPKDEIVGDVMEELPNEDETEESTESIVGGENAFDVDMRDLSNWRSGHYNPNTGTYAANPKRICLNEIIANTESQYRIKISDETYAIIVRELNEKHRLINSVELRNGDLYVPGEGTEYLAISLYNCVKVNEYAVYYSEYEALFSSNFEVGFYVEKCEPVLPENEIIVGGSNTILGVQSPNVSLAPSTGNLIPLREVFYNILISGDTSVHDVSAYGLTYFEFEDIWEDVIAKEGYVAFEAWGGVFPQVTKDGNGIVLTTKMYDLAGGDVRARYEKVMSCIEEVKAVAQGMSELDKVLYVYEYVMSSTTYSKNGHLTAYSGGALGNGIAKCEGYARACMLLLRELGIECYRISSTDMNHSWTYVKVNGEWYHLDATWDDADVVKHVYLLRNAEEFDSMPGRHYNWNYVTDEILPESTSKELVSWFVHDVTGQMYYENGMWYYTDADTGAIVRSDIYGNNYEVLVENKANGLLITGVTDGQVSYLEK